MNAKRKGPLDLSSLVVAAKERESVTAAPSAATRPVAPRGSLGTTRIDIAGTSVLTDPPDHDMPEIELTREPKARWKPGDVVIVPASRVTLWRMHDRLFYPEEAMASLKESLKANGQIHPAIGYVIPGADVEHDIALLAGARRLRACLEAGLPLKVKIVPAGDDRTLFRLMLADNVHDKPSIYEQGVSAKRFAAAREGQDGEPPHVALGISRFHFYRLLQIAELPPDVAECLPHPSDLSFRFGAELHSALEKNPGGRAALIRVATELKDADPSVTLEVRRRRLIAAVALTKEPKRVDKALTKTFRVGDRDGDDMTLVVKHDGSGSLKWRQGVPADVREQLQAFLNTLAANRSST